jgi:hypothetical protein
VGFVEAGGGVVVVLVLVADGVAIRGIGVLTYEPVIKG